MFQAIPWPDEVAYQMSIYCSGNDEYSRLVRRTVVRYTVLTIIEVLRSISSKVKKRFPTYDHLVEAGVITTKEVKALERAQSMTDYSCYWVPITWASSLTLQAWKNGYIKKAKFLVSLTKEMATVKWKCSEVFSYSYICFPLVYTQVTKIDSLRLGGQLLSSIRLWL